MALTITEALAELKTIDKRLEKKQEFVVMYSIRQEAPSIFQLENLDEN